MRTFANLLAGLGALVAVVAVTLAYLALLYWPDIGWSAVKPRTEQILVLATALLILGVLITLFGKKNLSGCRKITLSVLSTAIIATLGFNFTRTASNPTRHIENTNSKYKFTADWVSLHTKDWEMHLKEFKGKPHIRALEIGSFEGRSALWFLENILTHPTASITCIDIFNRAFERTFDENIRTSGFGNKLRKVKGSSHEVLRTVDLGRYDFVYIDGSHIAKDVLVDAVLTWDLLKTGGVIIFDDYSWRGNTGEYHSPPRRPRMAIDAFLTVFEPYMDVIHKGSQVVVKKKSTIDLDAQYRLRRSLLTYIKSIATYVFQ